MQRLSRKLLLAGSALAFLVPSCDWLEPFSTICAEPINGSNSYCNESYTPAQAHQVAKDAWHGDDSEIIVYAALNENTRYVYYPEAVREYFGKAKAVIAYLKTQQD